MFRIELPHSRFRLRPPGQATRAGRGSTELAEVPCHAGFTLIEMVGVLFLVALSAAVATVSFSPLRRSAAMDDVLDHITGCDAQVRDAARKEHLPLRLLFDPAAGTIAVGRPDVSADPHVMYTLPDGYRIERLVQARGASFDAAGENISAGGWSSSYALQVSGPNGSGWIRFAGFTGQVTRAKDERDATAILQHLAPAGDDAH